MVPASVALTVALLLGLLGPLGPGAAVAQERPGGATQRLDELLLREPPAGFLPAADGRRPADPREIGDVAVGLEQMFVSAPGGPRATVTLVLWDPTVEPSGTEFALGVLEGVGRGEEPFDAKAVHPAAIGWRAEEEVDGAPWHGHAVVLRHGGLIIQAWHWAPQGYPAGAVVAQLRDLVGRQRARPAVPALTVDVPREVVYLDALMLDEPASPGEPFVLLPGFSGLLTGEQLRRLQVDEAVTQAFGRLEGDIRGLTRHWAIPADGTQLRVGVIDLAADVRAGAALDGAARNGAFDDRSDTVTQEVDAGVPGHAAVVVTGRRGQYLVSVGASGERPPGELRDLAARTLGDQRGRLPEGATGRTGEQDGGSAAQLFGYVLGTLGVLALLRLAGGWWKRRRVRLRHPADRHGPAVDSVEGQARRLRRTGVAMGAALLVLASLALASLPYSPPVAAVALALVPGIVLARRRAERRARWVRVGLRRPRLVRSVLIAVGSVLVLAVAGLLAITAATTSVFGPSLSQSDLQRETAIDLGGTSSAAVLALPLLAAFLFRLARRQARLRADELRRLDERPPVLYLRGFADDKLRIPSIVSGRRPVVELLSPVPSESYEAVAAWALDAAGPTVAVAPPGARLGSLGAAKEHAADEEGWQAFVGRRMEASGVVAISLGRSEGLLWELGQLVERSLLGRVLILFPPVGDAELRARWAAAAPGLGGAAARSATLPLDPASALVAVFDDGGLRAFTADQRDEAGYRAAIAAALERIAAREAPIPAPVPAAPNPPAAAMQA